jgi:hypothetical protein
MEALKIYRNKKIQIEKYQELEQSKRAISWQGENGI